VWLSKVWVSLPLFLLIVGLAGGSGPLIGFSVFLLGAGAMARYWSRHALDRVVYEHLLPENRAFAGESLKFTMRLINDKFLPLPWLQIRESTPEGVEVDPRHVSPVAYQGYVQVTHATHLSWYERVTWSLNYRASVHGYYCLVRRAWPAVTSSAFSRSSVTTTRSTRSSCTRSCSTCHRWGCRRTARSAR